MYVVQASQLSRIFLPEYQNRLIQDPELIFKLKEPFKVTVPRATGAVTLTHMKPVHQYQLLPRKHFVQHGDGDVRELKGARRNPGDEIRDLVPWLTGGPDGMGSEETDIYGIVMLDIGADIVSSMVELMQRQGFNALTSMGADTEDGEGVSRDDFSQELVRMQKEYQQQVNRAVAAAREVADRKVRRALLITHTNLIQTWDAMETDGKKPYLPSAAEGLGAFILQEEISQSNAARQAMHGLLSRNNGAIVNG